MIYDIRHVTSYSYETQVSFARCSLRLEPRSGDGQQLVSHAVEIEPHNGCHDSIFADMSSNPNPPQS